MVVSDGVYNDTLVGVIAAMMVDTLPRLPHTEAEYIAVIGAVGVGSITSSPMQSVMVDTVVAGAVPTWPNKFPHTATMVVLKLNRPTETIGVPV